MNNNEPITADTEVDNQSLQQQKVLSRDHIEWAQIIGKCYRDGFIMLRWAAENEATPEEMVAWHKSHTHLREKKEL